MHPEGVQIQLAMQGKDAVLGLAAGAGGEGARLQVSFGTDSEEQVTTSLPGIQNTCFLKCLASLADHKTYLCV